MQAWARELPLRGSEMGMAAHGLALSMTAGR